MSPSDTLRLSPSDEPLGQAVAGAVTGSPGPAAVHHLATCAGGALQTARAGNQNFRPEQAEQPAATGNRLGRAGGFGGGWQPTARLRCPGEVRACLSPRPRAARGLRVASPETHERPHGSPSPGPDPKAPPQRASAGGAGSRRRGTVKGCGNSRNLQPGGRGLVFVRGRGGAPAADGAARRGEGGQGR